MIDLQTFVCYNCIIKIEGNNMELSSVNGIGNKTIKLFNNMGIYNVDDLVRNYPYKFDVLARRNLDDESYFDNMVIDGVLLNNPVANFFNHMNRLSFNIESQNRVVKVIIFNRIFLKRNMKVGGYVTVIGRYNKANNTITASNILLSKLPDIPLIIPVYHQTKGLTSKQINNCINKALDVTNIENNIPNELVNKYNFMHENEALRIIHNPKSTESLKVALKTLKYEELFSYMKKVKEMKEKNKVHSNLFIKNIDNEKVDKFINNIPFKLTLGQEKVTKDMLKDMQSDVRMNRLLQGDVGSGKTIVSFILTYACYTAGYQSALMAPTEVLATQHYENAVKLFSNTDFKIVLLTGKMTAKEKKIIYGKLLNNEIDLLIGTHALISDGVSFNKLGLVITDEQHRFGVNQRLVLKNNQSMPDVLSMSATPIPRTYALTIYGDTDVSSIKSMPKGRLPIKTYVKKTDELKSVLSSIFSALKDGNQAYVIAPMIEESEDVNYTNVNDLKHKFELAFKDYNTQVLHGRMTKEEKDDVMNKYKEGSINILISTTVVEVGVDVSNATIMVIFDADRFGLSTLHQLRGRVGRSDLQSYCYLISDKDTQRLKIMEETCDGYKISEADFKLRGQGDIFGNKQSGSLEFKLTDIKKDYDLLVKVRDDVNSLY